MLLRLGWLAAACVVAAAAVGTIGGSLGAESAVGATTLPACNPTTQPLRPELGAVTINQGLDSYRTTKLVRGKETLVRFFLKLPSYVGQTCSGWSRS